jgi:hypothetical protein
MKTYRSVGLEMALGWAFEVSVECGRIVRTHCLARLLFLWFGLIDLVLGCLCT